MRAIPIAEGLWGSPRKGIVYEPVGEGKAVVFWFHGFRGRVESYSDLMKGLAAAGFWMVTPQLYDPDRILSLPSPEAEAVAAQDFVSWFEAHQENFGIEKELPWAVSGHSRGAQAALRLLASSRFSFSAAAFFDPVDGLAQFGQKRIFGKNWNDVNAEALIIGTEMGTQGRFPRMPCAPDGVNHRELARNWRSRGVHVVLSGAGHDDILNADVVASEARNPFACQPGSFPARTFATAKRTLESFLGEALSR